MTFDLLQSIRDKAQNRIAKQMFDAAAETDRLLRALGDSIAAEYGCIPIHANTKDLLTAAEKVMNKGGGDWYELKDVARMTIVVPDLNKLKIVRAAINRRCVASQGMGMAKDELQHNEYGYTGLNTVVRLPNGRFGEIQVNVPTVLYAKMSESSFRRDLGMETFLNIKGRYRIRGGIGHGLYEIARSQKGSTEAKKAIALSVKYYGYMSGFPNWNIGKAIDGELEAYVKAYPQIFNKH